MLWFNIAEKHEIYVKSLEKNSLEEVIKSLQLSLSQLHDKTTSLDNIFREEINQQRDEISQQRDEISQQRDMNANQRDEISLLKQQIIDMQTSSTTQQQINSKIIIIFLKSQNL